MTVPKKSLPADIMGMSRLDYQVNASGPNWADQPA